jgi:hypothetical protein
MAEVVAEPADEVGHVGGRLLAVALVVREDSHPPLLFAPPWPSGTHQKNPKPGEQRADAQPHGPPIVPNLMCAPPSW